MWCCVPRRPFLQRGRSKSCHHTRNMDAIKTRRNALYLTRPQQTIYRSGVTTRMKSQLATAMYFSHNALMLVS